MDKDKRKGQDKEEDLRKEIALSTKKKSKIQENKKQKNDDLV